MTVDKLGTLMGVAERYTPHADSHVPNLFILKYMISRKSKCSWQVTYLHSTGLYPLLHDNPLFTVNIIDFLLEIYIGAWNIEGSSVQNIRIKSNALTIEYYAVRRHTMQS